MTGSESLDLQQVLGVLRRRSWIIVQLAIVAAAAGIALALQASREYDATASVLVGQSQALPLPGFSQSNNQTLIAPTAAKLIRTQSVAARVKRALGSDLSNGSLLDRVATSADVQDGIVSVTAHGGTGAEAAQIANAFANQFVATRAQAPVDRLDKAINAVRAALHTAPATGPEHDALVTQLSQLKTMQALPTPDAQLADPAVAPSSPAGPHVLRDAVVGLGLGVLLGLLLAFAIEALDPRVKASEELQRLVPAPQLASVPADVFRRSLRRKLRGEARVLFGARRHPEAFERLRTSLLVFNGEQDLKSVLVTSPRDEREGKTTVAANLAVSLAKIGLKVCVVDADLRRPRLSRHFGFGEGERGLTDVLEGAPLKSVIRRFPVPGVPARNGNGHPPLQGEIAVLCAGERREHPAELLASRAMQDAFDELEARYDVVVLDCAPLLAASDAMPLLARAGGTLLVVRLFHTPRKAAARAVRVIERARGALLGVVGTGVPARELREEGFGPWPVESSSQAVARVS
jgi:succinoglycan biosynthesis transport protein ExoP